MAKKRKHKARPKKRTYNTSGLKKYRATLSAIREHYGSEKKSRREVLDLYHKIKETDGFKDTPLNRINDLVDGVLGAKRATQFPPFLESFDWFHFENVLLQADAYFFPNNEMVFDLSAVGGGSIEFEYKNTLGQYQQNYRAISPLIRGAEKSSSIPQFTFLNKNGNTYTWILNGIVGRGPGGGGEPTKPTPTPSPVPDKGVELEKEKQKTLIAKKELTEARTKRSEQRTKESKERQKEIKQLEGLFKKGLITKAQFRKRFDKLG